MTTRSSRSGAPRSYAIGNVIDLTMGFRLTEADEVAGVDLAVHAETGCTTFTGAFRG